MLLLKICSILLETALPFSSFTAAELVTFWSSAGSIINTFTLKKNYSSYKF